MVGIQVTPPGRVLVPYEGPDEVTWWRWLYVSNLRGRRTRKSERYRWGKPTASEIAQRKRRGAGSWERLP